MLARQFRKEGYEVVFVLLEAEKLHRPEHRYHEVSVPYPSWIIDLGDTNLSLANDELSAQKEALIQKAFADCDLLFFNGYAIRLAERFGKKHICLLTGSDLISLCDYSYADGVFRGKIGDLSKRGLDPASAAVGLSQGALFKMGYGLHRLLKLKPRDASAWFSPGGLVKNVFHLLNYKIVLYHKIRRQREAVKAAAGFVFVPKGLVPDGDAMLAGIGVNEANRIPGLMIDADLSLYHEPQNIPAFRVFNVARFNWVKKASEVGFSQLDYKGNDVMIRGIGLFHRRHALPLDIVFVRKGKDLDETMALVEEEGIAHLVTWKEVLSQKEVLDEYVKADVVFDQLADSIVSMGGIEAMAVGRPVIAGARAEILDPILGEPTAVCDSKTPEDVCHWLEKLVLNQEFKKEKGVASRNFVMKHFSGHAVVERIEKHLGLKNVN